MVEETEAFLSPNIREKILGEDMFQPVGPTPPQSGIPVPDYQGDTGSRPLGGTELPQFGSFTTKSGGIPGGRGAAAGGRGGGRSPSPSIPKLHQATQLFSSRKVVETSYHASSLSRSSEEAPAKLFQQLSIQVEGTSGQAIKHIVPSAGSSKSMRFPLRPGKGTTGTKCIVKANHFFVELPDKYLHHYDVTITPEVTSRSFNRDVINKLVKLYEDTDLAKRLPAYDGQKSLYTAGPLPFAANEFQIL